MAKKYSKIEWCCFQKNGIKLIEPNEIRGKSYLDCAYENLIKIQSPALKIQNSSAYDACYNAFYSILQKAGIKCEIDECSFEIFNLIPEFSKEEVDLIKKLQTNLLEITKNHKRPKPVNEEPVVKFVETSKQVFDSLSPNEIRKIRNKIIMLLKKH